MGTLWLVCDASGSMIEGGKRLAVRGLVRAIEQALRLGYAANTDLKLVAWSSDVKVLSWSTDDEVPFELFQCRGSATAEPLAEFMDARSADRFIILTDGFLSGSSPAALKRWTTQRNQNTLRILKVGTDANPKLQGPEVFEAEDLFAAIDGWLGT